jgi:hypothetical protein
VRFVRNPQLAAAAEVGRAQPPAGCPCLQSSPRLKACSDCVRRCSRRVCVDDSLAGGEGEVGAVVEFTGVPVQLAKCIERLMTLKVKVLFALKQKQKHGRRAWFTTVDHI